MHLTKAENEAQTLSNSSNVFQPQKAEGELKTHLILSLFPSTILSGLSDKLHKQKGKHLEKRLNKQNTDS